MKHTTTALILTLIATLAGCTVCGDPESATIVHVDSDGMDYTIVEFADGARFRRTRQWGIVGDELTACRCQRYGRQWWKSPNVKHSQ